MSTPAPAQLHPDDTYLEPTLRDRIESIKIARGFALGVVLSLPVWAVVVSVLGINAGVNR